jgi:polyisoprenoid-binding protein YceI
MSKIALALAFSLSVLPALPAAATEWALDDTHTEIGFSVRHMMVTDVKGAFDKYTGVINIDDKDPTKSVVNVDIDVNSINTKVAKRDAHLKSPDFFDAANHPKMTFKSTKIEKGAKANTYKVTGDLTIRGTTKPVTFEVDFGGFGVDPWGNYKAGATAKAVINREDFGLTWNAALETGGVLVGKDITITLDLQGAHQA